MQDDTRKLLAWEFGIAVFALVVDRMGALSNLVLALLVALAGLMLVRVYWPALGWLGRPKGAPRLAWEVRVVANDVFVAITTDAYSILVSAEVEQITGTPDPYVRPFPIRWYEQSLPECLIPQALWRCLHLAVVEPQGNENEIPGVPPGSARGTEATIRLLRAWKPARFRFQMPSGREQVVYLPMRAGLLTFRLLRRRRLRVRCRVRSSDGAVNESRTVALGLNKDDTPYARLV